MSPTILVTGATGKQGGATLRHLLKADASVQIKALTRDTSSQSAQQLEAQGVELVQGDMSDPASLASALKGIDKAYLVTTPFSASGGDMEAEINAGKAFIDAAKEAGVKFLVFTAVGGSESPSGVPHFDSKRLISDHLASSGLAHAKVLPGCFMQNFPKENDSLGFWSLAVGKDLPIQMISTEDIGYVSAQALLNESKYSGKTIPLVTEELSIEQVADIYEKVTGKRPSTDPLPQAALDGADDDMQKMFKWIKNGGAHYNIKQIREQFPQSQTFADYLKQA